MECRYSDRFLPRVPRRLPLGLEKRPSTGKKLGPGGSPAGMNGPPREPPGRSRGRSSATFTFKARPPSSLPLSCAAAFLVLAANLAIRRQTGVLLLEHVIIRRRAEASLSLGGGAGRNSLPPFTVLLLGQPRTRGLPSPRCHGGLGGMSLAASRRVAPATDKPPTSFYDPDPLSFADLALPFPGSTPVGTASRLRAFE